MARRPGIEYHPQRSIRTDRSIVTHPYIGAHMDPEVEEIYNISFYVNDNPLDPNSVRGSENLLVGLAYSDQAEQYLQGFGINSDEVVKAGLKTRHTFELTQIIYRESFAYRAIFSTAAFLAYQEAGVDYKITGKHMVDAIRRTPQSAAYRSLSRMAVNPDF